MCDLNGLNELLLFVIKTVVVWTQMNLEMLWYCRPLLTPFPVRLDKGLKSFLNIIKDY